MNKVDIGVYRKFTENVSGKKYFEKSVTKKDETKINKQDSDKANHAEERFKRY